MNRYQIISDSSCDLPQSLLERLHISLVPYYATFDKAHYQKENEELSVAAFYQKVIEERLQPYTSLPPIQDYIDKFEPYLKQGLDIVCLCLSQKFSGSFQSAANAKAMLLEDYPDRRIEIVDTIQATGGQGLVVQEAALMQQAGYSLDAMLSKLAQCKATARIHFTVDSLEHLSRGGRIGKVSALAGSLLNIKPIIVMKDGELIPINKVRGRKKALQTIIQMTQDEIGQDSQNYRICLITVDRLNDIETIKAAFHDSAAELIDPFWTIGVTIGTHAGPTAIGICTIKKYDAV